VRGRRRFTRSSFRKRTFTWIPGLVGDDQAVPAQQRVLAFGLHPTQINTSIFGINLVSLSDITFHGGEGCVFTGCRYELAFMNGLVNISGGAAVPQPMIAQMAITLDDIDTFAGAASPPFLNNSQGTGDERILHMRSFIISSANQLESITAGASLKSDLMWIRGRLKVTRKVKELSLINMWVMVTHNGATVVPNSCTMMGHMRMGLKRPR